MAELHIEHIKAITPQAKGRVERLWVTFQDRLVIELRLLGIKTLDDVFPPPYFGHVKSVHFPHLLYPPNSPKDTPACFGLKIR
jgi:hypothetical protein